MTGSDKREARLRRAGGFTLLEILVALIVLGALMVGLTQGMHFGLRAWATEARIVTSRGDLDAVDRTLRGLIGQIDPGNMIDPPSLQGSATQLAMTTVLPAASGTLRDNRIDAKLSVDGTHQLVLRWLPHLHAVRFGPASAPNETVLLHGVDRIEFAYWATSPGHWTSTWSEATLPSLVRIRLIFSPGDHRNWPEIVAAPTRDRPDQ
jgi:general secretion pathway protein J